jgi:hypothetical protein
LSIGLFLLKAQGSGSKPSFISSKGCVAKSTPFTNLPAVSLSVRNLPVADHGGGGSSSSNGASSPGYYLLPCTFVSGQERNWSIAVFADYDFELTPV